MKSHFGKTNYATAAVILKDVCHELYELLLIFEMYHMEKSCISTDIDDDDGVSDCDD